MDTTPRQEDLIIRVYKSETDVVAAITALRTAAAGVTRSAAFRILDRAIARLDAKPDVDPEAREWAIRLMLEASCAVAS